MYSKLVLLLGLALTALSCENTASQLRGTYQAPDGERLALLRVGDDYKTDTLEVVSLRKRKFAFSVQPATPGCYYLAFVDKSWKLPLLMDGPLKLHIPSLQQIEREGSPAQTYLQEKLQQLTVLGNRVVNATEEQAPAAEAALRALEQEVMQAHGHNLVGVFWIWHRLAFLNYNELDALYPLLSAEMQATLWGRQIQAAMDRLWRTDPGVKAKDFTLQDIHGQAVTLSQVKARYLMLDFWASWCIPCRQENPQTRKIYARYRPLGLEIVGVSVDKQPANWRKAVEKDQCPWIQVLDEDQRVYKLYKGDGIPRWFLLDSTRCFVSAGRTAHELEALLSGLLPSAQ